MAETTNWPGATERSALPVNGNQGGETYGSSGGGAAPLSHGIIDVAAANGHQSKVTLPTTPSRASSSGSDFSDTPVPTLPGLGGAPTYSGS